MRSLQTSLFNLFSGALFNVMMKMLLSSPVRSSVTYREVMVAYPTFPKALKTVVYIECYALTYLGSVRLAMTTNTKTRYRSRMVEVEGKLALTLDDLVMHSTETPKRRPA